MSLLGLNTTLSQTAFSVPNETSSALSSPLHSLIENIQSWKSCQLSGSATERRSSSSLGWFTPVRLVTKDVITFKEPVVTVFTLGSPIPLRLTVKEIGTLSVRSVVMKLASRPVITITPTALLFTTTFTCV